MDLEKTINPLMVSFEQDFKMNNGSSHITDLIVLTIKSLIPSEDYVRVNIDYNRYNEEIKLWKYYRHGENTSLMNILGDIEPHVYWHHKDDTTYYRMLPIVLANKDYSFIKEEIIKNILFTTGNTETLIEVLILSKLLHCLILGEEDIIDKLKQEVIKFSQVEFLEEYKDYIRIPIEKYEGNYSVVFEQNKIYALNTLNLSFSQRFKILEDCIEILLNHKDGETSLGKSINACRETKYSKSFKLDNYYNELSTYIYKLRKGRIDPEALKIEKYRLPNVFQFKEGQVFYHSLLNNSKVIKREEIGNKIIIQLETKSGIYKFVK